MCSEKAQNLLFRKWKISIGLTLMEAHFRRWKRMKLWIAVAIILRGTAWWSRYLDKNNGTHIAIVKEIWTNWRGSWKLKHLLQCEVCLTCSYSVIKTLWLTSEIQLSLAVRSLPHLAARRLHRGRLWGAGWKYLCFCRIVDIWSYPVFLCDAEEQVESFLLVFVLTVKTTNNVVVSPS